MAESSPHEQHEVLFKPHTEPNHVILTGSFDDWSKSINLTKTQTGFEARIRLPYNEKTPYKFIVDGTWLVDESNPTGYDNIGNLNNIYTPPPQPPAHKLTPPTTPVVIGGFDTSKETSPGTANGKANGAPNGGYVPKVEGGDEKRRSSSRLSLSDFANTVAARDGISSAYEYVKSGLGAVIGGVVGVDPINAGQIAIPTPNTATSFNTQVEPPTPAPAPELAPKVPIGIVPVNSTEHNTIAAENGNAGAANGDIHTHSPVVSPVKDRSEPSPVPVKEAEKAPEVPVSILPVADKETAQPAAPLPETTTVPEPTPVVPAVEVAAPAEEEDKKVEEKLVDLAAAEPTVAPVSEELLDKAVPTPLGPVVPPEATKEEKKKEEETVPAPAPVAAPVEEATPAPAPAAEPTPTKPEEKVERPSTPPPAATPAAAAAAPSAPSTPSKPSKAPAASAPSTPLSIKKGTSNGSHFKRGSLSGTFGSIRGKKEGKEKDEKKKKEKEEDTSSSSSGSSDAGEGVGKDGKKKKKRESILHKIKRVLTPHHHDHHHHHHHHENGEKKEETKA